MYSEKVGVVTENEKREILILNERKSSLKELLLTLDSPMLTLDERDSMYKKIIEDMEEVSLKYREWWTEKSSKYNWKYSENGEWSINFHTNEIFLIEEECACTKQG